MRIDAWPWFDATTAFCVAAVGLALIGWEMVRPGLIVPGAVGAVLFLCSAARFGGMRVSAWAVAALVGAALLLIAEMRLHWPGPPGLASAVLTTVAMARWGATDAERVRWWIAAPISIALTAAAVILGSAAWRGYTLKRNF